MTNNVSEVKRGDVFDTLYESGCIALESTNSHGSFLAYDSDGVECHFHIAMIDNVHDHLSDDEMANARDLAGQI